MHQLAPGTLLNGKYLVGAVLGEGGFGITYFGRDTLLDVRIAIKEYYPKTIVARGDSVGGISTVSVSVDGAEADFEAGKVKFLSEARMLAKFSSEPNIVSVRDFFEANNTAYIVMEYLEGIDLKEYLVRNGLQTFENAYALVSPVMAALAKVHKQGLIHRDISPSNIMVLNSGVVKLLDFGAARTAGTDQELSVVVKRGFAPPEQYSRRGDQGPWTDVYALCATMYKLLTGAAPADSVGREGLIPASSVNPSVTPLQDAVLAKGMALAEHERYASMEELMAACRNALRPTAVPVTQGQEEQTVLGQNAPPVSSPPHPKKNRKKQKTDRQNTNGKKKAPSTLALVLTFLFLIPAFAGMIVGMEGLALVNSYIKHGQAVDILVFSGIFCVIAVICGTKYFPRVDNRSRKPNIVCGVLTGLLTLLDAGYLSAAVRNTRYILDAYWQIRRFTNTVHVNLPTGIVFVFVRERLIGYAVIFLVIAAAAALCGWFWLPRLPKKQKRIFLIAAVAVLAAAAGIGLLL